MEMTFLMCDEKVERLSSMDCASPMSQNTCEKTESTVPSAAGTNSPHAAIRQNNPHILRVTVLPPVFGPETSRKRQVLPSESETGTAVLRSSSGCRPFTMAISPCFESCGRAQPFRYPYSALAKAVSSCTSRATSSSSSARSAPTRRESCARMRSTSSRSSAASSRSSLFISRMYSGSMKKVAPLAERSCTKPRTFPLYSARTGRT